MSDSAAPAASSAPASDGTSSAPAVESKPAKQLIDIDGEKLDIEQLKRERKKWQGADSAFREAAKTRESNEAFLQRLEQDPESVLSDPRITKKKRELAEKWLMEELDQAVASSDPREVELQALRDKNKSYEDKEAEDKAKAKQEQYQQTVTARKEAIANILTKALEATPFHGHPELQAEALAEMAKYMRICKKAGYEATPEDLAEHVKNQRLTSFRSLVSKLDGDDLINVLGEDLAKRLRLADLKRLKASRAAPPPQVSDSWDSRSENGERVKKMVDPWSVRGGR